MLNLFKSIILNQNNFFYHLKGYLIPLVFLLIPQSLLADWINLTGAETSPNIAEITIHNNHIELKLEIFINDLQHYEELIPADLYKNSKKIIT